MTTSAPTRIAGDYARAYAKGRHAAEEHEAAHDNPYRPGSSAFHGWNDGHYDVRSARHLAIERHSAQLWSETVA